MPTRHKFTILKQVVEKILSYLVGNLSRTFSPWSHVVSLVYAQLAHSFGLNDVVDPLGHHLGVLGLAGQREHGVLDNPPQEARREDPQVWPCPPLGEKVAAGVSGAVAYDHRMDRGRWQNIESETGEIQTESAGKIKLWDDSEIKYNDQGGIDELPYFTTLIQKQGKPSDQQIPMSFGLWEVLKRVVGERKQGPVWPVATPPWSEIRELGILKKAGLTKYRPFHDFRKSFKTEGKKQGLAKEFTKYLQGHATDSMDEYYTQFRRLDVQAAFMAGYKDQKKDLS
jgi:hypothetical protein